MPLCVLLVAALVLSFYRYRYRILRDRANAVLARDRAHLDLQLMVHQVQRVQIKSRNSDGSLASSKSRLPSMPPGPPSSTASGPTSTWPSTAPPHSWEDADQKPTAAQLMTEQQAPHSAWVEASRQWYAESSGVKRFRAAFNLVAPAHLAPAASPGPERVELAELAVLAEMEDDETVAALREIVGPGHAGSTCSPAPASQCGNMPAQANQEMQMHAAPLRVDLALLAALAGVTEMASDDETVVVPQDIVSPGHASSTCSPTQVPAHCGSMPTQANQQMQMHAVPMRVELAELASDEETVAPPGIVSPGYAGTGLARAPVGVSWSALADRWRRHWETKQTDSSSASVTTSTYSYRSSCSSSVSRPTPENSATPAFSAPPAPPPAPPAPVVAPPAPPPAPPAPVPVVAPPTPSTAPLPMPADLLQMFDEPIGPGTAPTAPPATAPLVSEASVKLEQQHSTCSSTAQTSHCGSIPAQTNQPMQMHAVPVQCGNHLPAALACSSITLQHVSGFVADTSELHFLFARLFTPKHPSTLPRSQWLSYPRLFSIVQPYAPAGVWKQGRGNLKQLMIEWCQHHPAYAGLEQSAWCMRLKDEDQPKVGLRHRLPTVYKFCLEYTP